MATWTSLDKYSGASSATYNSSAITYDDETYNYIGQITTVWTNENKN